MIGVRVYWKIGGEGVGSSYYVGLLIDCICYNKLKGMIGVELKRVEATVDIAL